MVVEIGVQCETMVVTPLQGEIHFFACFMRAQWQPLTGIAPGLFKATPLTSYGAISAARIILRPASPALPFATGSRQPGDLRQSAACQQIRLTVTAQKLTSTRLPLMRSADNPYRTAPWASLADWSRSYQSKRLTRRAALAANSSRHSGYWLTTRFGSG